MSVGYLKEDVATNDITMPKRLALHVGKAAGGGEDNSKMVRKEKD